MFLSRASIHLHTVSTTAGFGAGGSGGAILLAIGQMVSALLSDIANSPSILPIDHSVCERAW